MAVDRQLRAIYLESDRGRRSLHLLHAHRRTPRHFGLQSSDMYGLERRPNAMHEVPRTLLAHPPFYPRLLRCPHRRLPRPTGSGDTDSLHLHNRPGHDSFEVHLHRCWGHVPG